MKYVKLLSTATFVALLSACNTTQGTLDAIQMDGHNYYRVAYNAAPSNVERPFQVLERNKPGSCSHEVAIKIKMIRENMPHLNPQVIVYDMLNARGVYWPHTAIVIKQPQGGYVVLNNRDRWVDYVDTLDGFRNHKVMTYEAALAKYNTP